MKCPGCGTSLWFVRTFCPFCKVTISAPARPRSVAVISWLAIVAGAWILLALTVLSTPGSRRVLAEVWSQHPFATLWLCGVPVVGLLCGFFMLRGMNWARWVLSLWFGYNSVAKLVVGDPKLLPQSFLSALLVGTAVYLLFRPPATAFFRGPASVAPKSLPTHEPPTS